MLILLQLRTSEWSEMGTAGDTIDKLKSSSDVVDKQDAKGEQSEKIGFPIMRSWRGKNI